MTEGNFYDNEEEGRQRTDRPLPETAVLPDEGCQIDAGGVTPMGRRFLQRRRHSHPSAETLTAPLSAECSDGNCYHGKNRGGHHEPGGENRRRVLGGQDAGCPGGHSGQNPDAGYQRRNLQQKADGVRDHRHLATEQAVGQDLLCRRGRKILASARIMPMTIWTEPCCSCRWW